MEYALLAKGFLPRPHTTYWELLKTDFVSQTLAIAITNTGQRWMRTEDDNLEHNKKELPTILTWISRTHFQIGPKLWFTTFLINRRFRYSYEFSDSQRFQDPSFIHFTGDLKDSLTLNIVHLQRYKNEKLQNNSQPQDFDYFCSSVSPLYL